MTESPQSQPPLSHSLLILVPAYNEEERIEPTLRSFATYFTNHFQDNFQIVAVLNGCTDGTAEVVARVAQDHPSVACLDFPGRIGKGGALIEGLKLAPRAEIIGYIDADGATAPEAFHDLVTKLPGHDCVIGSRWLDGAILHQEQTNKRQLASRVFNAVIRMLFGMPYHDTQCGAKVLTKEAVEQVHDSLTIADMAFDINLLYGLKRAKLKVLETPTEWTDKLGTKVKLGRTSLVMLLSAIRLRLVYSPFYKFLRPLRPIEAWVYKSLSAPPPRSRH